ncbi:hypothetical protein [Marinibactrum halimedae]|uniref:Uncharacterized protein n=1 Tax=Marinibactrum halimedae TaxID=1444977 RepID=A0AA37T8F4_9GAMM|nr:hypothetical protein [Marinibactrum halimedae]MCD9459920.1 hypothetical protein [Marinibactrum halimedae]GLS25225.1 hypothetical protein GCM10007877_09390 [Marinibactrum halimedae]
MLMPDQDQFIRKLCKPCTIQTHCRPPRYLCEYAADFQRDSVSEFISNRRSDGLSEIDALVAQAVQIPSTNYPRIFNVCSKLLPKLAVWLKGFNPSAPNQALQPKSREKHSQAIRALTGGVYCWYMQSAEAAMSAPAAIHLMKRHQDIPISLYHYRFSRKGYRLQPAGAPLYRGDTRAPDTLWKAGGFYPKIDADAALSHDPHLKNSKPQQMIVTTNDAVLVNRFAWHNSLFCPEEYHYIFYDHDGPKAITGFIYEIDKSGHQCVEVSGVTPGREVAFLAIPNQYIRRFRMRFYAGSPHNVEVSDWIPYNQQAISDTPIIENKAQWRMLRSHYFQETQAISCGN